MQGEAEMPQSIWEGIDDLFNFLLNYSLFFFVPIARFSFLMIFFRSCKPNAVLDLIFPGSKAHFMIKATEQLEMNDEVNLYTVYNQIIIMVLW